MIDPVFKEEDEEGLNRLVSMTTATNLVALDKVIAAVRRAPASYAAAAARTGSIAEKLVRACREVGEAVVRNKRR